MRAKLLTVFGMDDRMGPLDVGLHVTRLVPDSRMHIFTQCGHYPQMEHADAFNRLVTDFLLN
jgi:pimeloyl-ACP methyl ester carboxylesterase